MELYWIVVYFWGIWLFIELCFGKDKLCIILNFFVLDFGIIFNGDEIKNLKGGDGNGLVILFLFKFWFIKFFIIDGYLDVFLWFFESVWVGRFIYFRRKFWLKFFIRNCSFCGL